MKKKFGLILTIIFLTIFGVYFGLNIKKFEILTTIPLYVLIFIALFKFGIVFVNGLFTKVILKAFDRNITIIETTYVSVISAVGNYFIPMRGGAGIRAVYLKNKFKLPYSYFLSTLSGNYIITFLINSVIGLVSLAIICEQTGIYSWPLTLAFLGVFFLTAVLSFINTPELPKKLEEFQFVGRISTIISEITRGWNTISNDRSLLYNLIVLTLTNFAVSMLLTFTEFSVLDIDFAISNLLLYTSLASLSLLISLTPGSIGIKEAVFLISSSVIGISEVQVLQLALLDRGVQFLVLGVSYIVLKIKDSWKKSELQ